MTRAQANAPTLETARLTLRGHRLDDFAASAAMWGDPVVVRHIGGRPFTGEEVWARILRYAGHWELLGHGFWAVEEKASGRFVGEVGFADFHRDIVPAFGDAPECGWVLAPWSFGQGYATEAVQAVHAWGDRHFTAARTVALIDTGNTASLRVAAKCGYAEAYRTTYHGDPAVVYARPRG